jgi:hypothetical protein
MRHFDIILDMGLLRRGLNDITTEGYNGAFAYPTIKNRVLKFYLLKLVTRKLPGWPKPSSKNVFFYFF